MSLTMTEDHRSTAVKRKRTLSEDENSENTAISLECSEAQPEWALPECSAEVLLSPESNLDSETGDGDCSWKKTPVLKNASHLAFRVASCLLTPGTERLSPLPGFAWADPLQVWEIMCRKDEFSVTERDENYFSRHPCLQPRMRSILLDWLIEVCEVYKLHRETFHLTMDYIDRYLSTTSNVPKQSLQLIGVTCLFIAAKAEEIYPPKLTEFAYVTDGACSELEIMEKELVVLKTLKWNLSAITVNGWLNLYMQLCSSGLRRQVLEEKRETNNEEFLFPSYSGLAFAHTCHLVDLAMLDEGSLKFPYSVIAASALYLACNKDLALKVSGFKWPEVEPCVRWMTPFHKVLHEEKQLSGETKVIAWDQNVPVIVMDDSHNIQTHSVSTELLEKGQKILREINSELTERSNSSV